jgi:hypothetical protein
MWTTIANADAEGLAAYSAAVAELALPGAGAKQRAGCDVVALYEDAACAKPGYDALVKDVAERVFAVKLELPAGLKSTARIVEKSRFRVDAPPGTVDGVFDVVRGMLVAPSMGAVAAVVKAFGSNPRVVLTRVKNRYDDAAASAGGWRDLMLNFYLADDDAKHVCEVQVVHRQMLVAREGLSGHSIYNRVRNASELCEYIEICCVDHLGWTTDDANRAGFRIVIDDRILGVHDSRIAAEEGEGARRAHHRSIATLGHITREPQPPPMLITSQFESSMTS